MVVVVLSILIHGGSATPALRRLERRLRADRREGAQRLLTVGSAAARTW